MLKLSDYYVMNGSDEEKILITRESAVDIIDNEGVFKLESYIDCFREGDILTDTDSNGVAKGMIYVDNNSAVDIFIDSFEDYVNEGDINKLLSKEMELCEFVNKNIKLVGLNVLRDELEKMMRRVENAIDNV